MKAPVSILLLVLSLFYSTFTAAQNVSINVLTLNSGYVNIGGTVFVQITIANTSTITSVPSYKLRPQLSVPVSIVSIPATGHVLPAGWSIITNASGVIRVSNGTDQIPPSTSRDILIAIQGNTIGGPQTVSGNLLFSNGVAPGSASGPATAGDVPGDNSSSSTVQVYNPIPVNLTEFNAALFNCHPVLTWKTETELNSYRFEIEYAKSLNSIWQLAGTITAKGNSNSKTDYTFTDKNSYTDNERLFYRLKMIDKDGMFDYSEIKPITKNCKTADVYTYPNPVKNNILNVILSGAGENTRSVFLSVSGQVIFKSTLKNGRNVLRLPNIPNGLYILNIADESGFEKQLKVTIQN